MRLVTAWTGTERVFCVVKNKLQNIETSRCLCHDKFGAVRTGSPIGYTTICVDRYGSSLDPPRHEHKDTSEKRKSW